VKKTGYYCVGTTAFSQDDYTAIVEFRNAFGELPAAQIAKLPFYGGLTITYAVIGAYVQDDFPCQRNTDFEKVLGFLLRPTST